MSLISPIFTNSKLINSRGHRTRKTSESWHTAVTNNTNNNSILLPTRHNIIIYVYIRIYYTYTQFQATYTFGLFLFRLSMMSLTIYCFQICHDRIRPRRTGHSRTKCAAYSFFIPRVSLEVHFPFLCLSITLHDYIITI